MGMRKGKADAQDKARLLSAAADQRALEAFRAFKQQQRQAQGGLFSGFGQGSQHVHVSNSQPMRPPQHPGGVDPAVVANLIGLDPPQIAADPVNDKRNWGELLRNVPEGIYRLAQRGSDGLTFAGTRSDLDPGDTEYEVEDATGPSMVEVYDLTMSEQELRYRDDKLGQIIDEHIGLVVTSEAMELLGKAPDNIAKYDENPVVAMVKLLLERHAMYPAIHLSERLGKTPSGEGRVLSFAVQWVYEPALDEDDEDEYDPGVCPDCGAHKGGCKPGCTGRR